MSKDELLTALARAAEKDEIEEDPRWAALVEGRSSEADRRALEELAALDARNEEALALLTPLGEEAKARMAERILGEMARAPQAPAPPAAEAEVIALKPKRKWVPVAAALALAAAVALFVTLRRESPPEIALADPIPSYEVALVGGERDDRAVPAPADAQAPIVLGPGSSLEIVLRPATPYRKPIAVRGFLIQNGRAQLWNIAPAISADGAVRIAGAREALFANVASGSYEIAIAIGPPDALPDAEAVARGGAGDKGARLQRLARTIVLVEPPPMKVEPAPVLTAPQPCASCKVPPLVCANCEQPQSTKPPRPTFTPTAKGSATPRK